MKVTHAAVLVAPLSAVEALEAMLEVAAAALEDLLEAAEETLEETDEALETREAKQVSSEPCIATLSKRWLFRLQATDEAPAPLAMEASCPRHPESPGLMETWSE